MTLYTTDKENEYKYGEETLVIKPIADVDEEDTYLGYKHFTAEELDNLAVRLRFTAFGGVENLYVVADKATHCFMFVRLLMLKISRIQIGCCKR